MDLHERLWETGKHSALRLDDYRTNKKDGNKEIRQTLQSTPEYQAGLKVRYTIERKIGEGNLWHRWGRCRYLALIRHGLQAHFTVLALNLKRIVFLLTGITFRQSKPKLSSAA
jgi:hypothetical protein